MCPWESSRMPISLNFFICKMGQQLFLPHRIVKIQHDEITWIRQSQYLGHSKRSESMSQFLISRPGCCELFPLWWQRGGDLCNQFRLELPSPGKPWAVVTLLWEASYEEGWSGGGIAVSNAALFLWLMGDQLIPTGLVFKLRVEETFPQRVVLSRMWLPGSST